MSEFFYDAADWRNLPRGQDACFYGDGPGAPSAAERDSIGAPNSRIITRTGNPVIASIIDGRPDNNLSDPVVRGFVRGRRGAAQDAIIYTPRAFVREYQRVLYDDGTGQLGAYSRLYWWIATLDGIDWTADALASDIAAHWDAMIDPGRIWAVQNNQIPAIGPNATADESKRFLDWRPT